jgi:RND family efflux transporter MFP subunit
MVAACQKAAPQMPPRKAPEVVYTCPVEKEVTDSEEFTGRTEAVKNVEVRAMVSGYLDTMFFTEGDLVHKGDVLFQIDPRPFEAEVARAEANLAAAEAHQARLQNDLRRARELIQNKSIGREEFDRIVGDESEAGGAVKAAAAALNIARLNLEYSHVRAPLTGHISRRMVDPGSMVKSQDTPLTRIVSQDPIYALFDIDERTYLRVQRYLERRGDWWKRWTTAAATFLRLQRPAQIQVEIGLADEEGFPHTGTINFVDVYVDPNSVSVWVRGVLANPDNLLKPGLFIRARLPIGDPYRAILIPERALRTDQGQKFIYVVGSDNKVEDRRVELGEQHGQLRVVKKGVALGERVIVSGMQRVKAKMEVTPKEETPTADDASTRTAEARPPAAK